MTSIEFIEKRINDMLEHGADLGEDLPALMEHIKQAKIMDVPKQNDVREDDIEIVTNEQIGLKRWQDWEEFNKMAQYPSDCMSPYADGFTRGAKWMREQLIPKQKENTYTEEQVREAIEDAFYAARLRDGGFPFGTNELVHETFENYFQSLKQPKQ